jgi:hypothetical protein
MPVGDALFTFLPILLRRTALSIRLTLLTAHGHFLWAAAAIH